MRIRMAIFSSLKITTTLTLAVVAKHVRPLFNKVPEKIQII